MRAPKSIEDSKRITAFAYPLLIGVCATYFVSARLPGRVGLVILVVMILTDWSSAGVISEEIYNDVLLAVDVGLFFADFLLIYFTSKLTHDNSFLGTESVWISSGMVFLLYSIWDLAALSGRDTRAIATVSHLKRFAYSCLAISGTFFAGGVVITRYAAKTSFSVALFQLAAGLIWLGVLIWWNIGKFRAALKDS